VKLRRTATASTEPESADVLESAVSSGGKGRATPKRREVAPKKQPIAAPRTHKEATQWRKQQTAQAKGARATAQKKLTTAEYRAAMKRGDESVLPKKDRGPVRSLARDWVDSHRMGSNYLLILFPVLLLGSAIHILTYISLAIFIVLLIEWFLTGRRVRALAISRFGECRDTPMTLGMYCGTRAYMPRRFRSPQPRFAIGDQI
jgi:hypothetical protein